MLNDACLGSADYQGCTAVYHGVMSKGLQATEQTLVDLVGELLSHRTDANGDMAIVRVCVLNSDAVQSGLLHKCLLCGRVSPALRVDSGPAYDSGI